jgi:hypothetical protein
MDMDDDLYWEIEDYHVLWSMLMPQIFGFGYDNEPLEPAL